MDVDEVLLDTEDRMEKAVVAFAHVLATVRTGRASTALVEHFEIEHYGQMMPLNQLATLGTPDPTLITIQVWDQTAVAPIMKAVQASDLGITPSNEGALIRLPVPPLTEERRRELVKQVGGRTEEARIAVRNVRRHAIDELRKALRAGELSEDEERRVQGDVEKLTHGFAAKLDDLSKEKERELLEI